MSATGCQATGRGRTAVACIEALVRVGLLRRLRKAP